MLQHKSKVLVVGSGPAGYTAAIYSSRANLHTILVAGNQLGGQLVTTTDVENYPGFGLPIQGPLLMEEMEKQAKNVGAQIIMDTVMRFERVQRPFTLMGSENSYVADSVIIATGAQAKWLGLDSEMKFRGYGVSGCATCDGFFARGKEVAVIGGGNTAVEEALYLTNHASKVYLIHRRDSLRAEKILQDRLFNNKKIELVWNHTLEEVLGDDDPKSVTGISLKSTKNGAIRKLNLEYVFIAIGHAPSTMCFKDVIDLDSDGYIITKNNDSMVTNIPGVFAAGDVRDKIYRQAVTAAGDGCKAALEAIKFIDAICD